MRKLTIETKITCKTVNIKNPVIAMTSPQAREEAICSEKYHQNQRVRLPCYDSGMVSLHTFLALFPRDDVFAS
jgi:hypothetical protein